MNDSPLASPNGMRMIDYFDRGHAIAGDRPCMIDGDHFYSYQEVSDSSHRIAQSLIRDGFAAGGKAAVLCGNSAIAFQCILGMLRADGVWVTANHHAGAEENAYLLDLLDVDVLFIHADVAERIALFREQCPKLRRYILLGGSGSEKAGSDIVFEDWLLSGEIDATPVRRSGDANELTMLVNTGGTTGLSKGVMWNNRTWGALVSSLDASMPMRKPPVNLVAAPMTHAAGPLALSSMVAGGTVVILPQFEPEAVMKAIQQHRVSYVFLPPTAIYMMLSHPAVRDYDYSSLEYLNYAGAPMSPERLRDAVAIFGKVLHGSFGQTEAPMCLTAIRPSEHIDEAGNILRPGSCGRPTLHSRVEIMDEDGNLLGPNQAGEIVARGPLVMAGYYRNDEATAEASRFAWHHTGDIGIRDEQGWFTIVDRKKDMINSGGFNVYPAEVERAILGFESIQDCAVVGIPDDKWGEAVCAAVELKAGFEYDEQALRDFVRDKLGSVKSPKTYELISRLPRSAAGKVLRAKVREKYWKNAGRSI